jgi:hypothetical protein
MLYDDFCEGYRRNPEELRLLLFDGESRLEGPRDASLEGSELSAVEKIVLLKNLCKRSICTSRGLYDLRDRCIESRIRSVYSMRTLFEWMS